MTKIVVTIEVDSVEGLAEEIAKLQNGMWTLMAERGMAPDVSQETQPAVIVPIDDPAPEPEVTEPPIKKKRASRAKAAKKMAPATDNGEGGNGKATDRIPTAEELNELARAYSVKHGADTVRAYLTECGSERMRGLDESGRAKMHSLLNSAPEA